MFVSQPLILGNKGNKMITECDSFILITVHVPLDCCQGDLIQLPSNLSDFLIVTLANLVHDIMN